MVKHLLFLIALSIAPALHAQTVSYIHPDACAPGMTIYTEVIGPNILENFGKDGIGKCRIELINTSDANRLAFSPSVTMWKGRMIAQMVAVDAQASPGPVPYRIIGENGISNVDTFYIMSPQTMSSSLPSGQLGSGGNYGVRSRRNTLVVESLDLGAGMYTISSLDPDPKTPGNQALLPFTIVSAGDVRIAGELTASGTNLHGIAGGGGAGGRDNFPGGNGYTGGAGTQAKGGVGSGSNGFDLDGGISLNQTGGGIGVGPRSWDDQGGGGGTGFPFGISGIAGTWYAEGGFNSPAGIGAGSGGGEKSGPDSSFGGGGGGYATAGESSGPWNGINGGKPYGNTLLVPFCGGSGGAAGNQFGDGRAGDGGSGGGAISIVSNTFVLLTGKISADGADGESTQGVHKGGGGGAGSGGAILISAPQLSICGELSTLGGKGGEAVHKFADGGLDGGDGGIGRKLLVGRLEDCGVDPGTGHANSSLQESILSGVTEPFSPVRVYLKDRDGKFDFDTPTRELISDSDGVWGMSVQHYIRRQDQIVILQLVHVDGSGTGDDSLWVLSRVRVANPDDVLDVPVSPATSLSFNRVSEIGQHLRVEMNAPQGTEVAIKLMDILGRTLGSTAAFSDAAGSILITFDTHRLPVGYYFVTARSNGQTVSRSVHIRK